MNNPTQMDILIIDDNALTRFGLKTVLKTRQNINQILEAANSEKGIELSKKFKPDIVIMDIELPSLNGIETIKKIKYLNKNTKVIILTCHKDEGHVFDAVNVGVHGYCLKDITPEKLLNILEFINQGAIWFDQRVANNILEVITSARKNPEKQRTKNEHNNNVNNGNGKNPQLTEREVDVLSLIVDGYSNAEISEKLCVSIHTAKAHVCNILHKLCVEDRTQAAIKALKNRII